MTVSEVRPSAVIFAFSPLQEVLRALHVFLKPADHAEQMGWIRQARRRITPALKKEIHRWKFLLVPSAELFPDLFPSLEPLSISDDLQALRRNPGTFADAMVRRMIGKPLISRSELEDASKPAAMRKLARAISTHHAESAAIIDSFVRNRTRTLADFCDFVASFYDHCLADRWDDLQARALDDAVARKDIMKRFGISDMLRTLTRELSVTGTARKASVRFGEHIAKGPSLTFERNARMTLTPSYFIWPRATFVVLQRTSIDVRITYPLASPSLAMSSPGGYDALARRYSALADPTRLRMLEMLGQRHLSTREFAGLLSLSEAGASRHLSILRNAGFVTSARDGYFVLYTRTKLAETFLALQANR